MFERDTLPHGLAQQVRWHPDKVAFAEAFADTDDDRYTFREVDEESYRFANALTDLGVEKGDRIAFLNQAILDVAIAYTGVLKAGAIPAPIHAREATRTISSMVEDVSPSVLLYQEEFSDTVASLQTEVDSVDHYVTFAEAGDDLADATYQGLMDEATPELPDVTIHPEDPAFIVHTSGSTGRPKPIVHTHEEAVESAKLAQHAYLADRSDIVLNHYSPSFISWHLMTYSFTLAGATVVFLEEWDPSVIPELVEEEDITMWFPVATQWKHVLAEDLSGYDLSSLDRVGTGGESLSEDKLTELRDRVCDDVIQIYASTETMTSGSILFPEEFDLDTKDSVGTPILNVEMRLVEPSSRDPSAIVDDGEVGEIFVRGPSVAQQVWNDPELTRRNFHEDGWWMTGDLGRVGENGCLYLEGRKDNMIKSGGIKIYPEQVEDVIEDHPAVIECAVIGVPHEKWTQTPKAFIVADDASITVETIDAWCKDHEELADFARPREIQFVDELPRTNSGKLDRTTLREREGVE